MRNWHWQDVVTGLVGLWLIAFPFIAAAGAAGGFTVLAINFIVCGIIALLLAASALAAFRAWEEWIGVVLGLWLIASPWLLGFASEGPARWNALVSGLVIAVLAGWALVDDGTEGHA